MIKIKLKKIFSQYFKLLDTNRSTSLVINNFTEEYIYSSVKQQFIKKDHSTCAV